MTQQNLSISEFVEAFEAGRLRAVPVSDYSVLDDGLVDRSASPTSADYAASVMRTWRRLSGRSSYHAVVDEAFELDPSHLAKPFPYSTSHPFEVGAYFGAISFLLRHLSQPAGARIVELGAGWGHLALSLAQTGYATTAVDLNQASVDLLRQRAAALAVPLDVVRSQFLDFLPEQPADAVIFFEAFHHCDEPLELLDRCSAMLALGGQLIFLAEAIYDDFYAPWGVRLDGSAVHATRAYGWLELGFDRSFFYRELMRRGFDIADHISPELFAYGTLVIATKRTNPLQPGLTCLAPDEEHTWAPRLPSASGRFATDRSVVTLEDGRERGVVDVDVANHCDAPIQIDFELGTSSARVALAAGDRRRVTLDADAGPRRLHIFSDSAPSASFGLTSAGVYVEAVGSRSKSSKASGTSSGSPDNS